MKQVYFSKKFYRLMERKFYNEKNDNLIKKNKAARILVILHLFYPKSWKEIKEYLKNLDEYNTTIIITVTEGMISDNLIEKISRMDKRITVIKCKNLGFDLRPFLTALKNVNLDDYDIVIKLQSKSTKRPWIYIYNQLFLRRDWFLDLFEGVLSAKHVHKNINLLYNEDDIGLLAADNLIVRDPTHKEEMVIKKAKEYNLHVPNNYKFVAGTCFAIKAKLLKNIQDFPWKDEYFENHTKSRGMSFAHFFERYICTQVESVWGKKIVGTKVRESRHKFLRIIGFYFKKHDANRLHDLGIKIDPEFFYWQLDNTLIKYKFVKIPFKKIMYSDGVNRIPFIDNPPYRYLKGDTEGYKKYCEYHEKNGLPVMSVERFERLRKSIKVNGYNPKNVIMINNKNELMDGQHRAACLCDLMGEDAEIEVLKINIISVRNAIKKVIPNNILNIIRKIR